MSSETFNKLALAVDNASDDGDIDLFLQLDNECLSLVENSKRQ